MRTAPRHPLSFAVTILLALCASHPAEARRQKCQSTAPAASAALPAASPTDIASVQSNLNDLVAWLQANAQTTAQQANLQNLQAQVSNLSSDQLAMVANAIATGSDMDTFSSVVNKLLSSNSGRQVSPGLALASPPPITPTLAPPAYDVCNPATGSPFAHSQIPSDTQTIFNITETIDALKTIADILNFTVCQTTFVVAGEGTNIAGCVVTMVLTAVVDGLQIDKDGLTFCDSNASQAEVTAAWSNTKDIDTNLAKLSQNTQDQFQQVTDQLTALDASLTSHTTAIDSEITNEISSANTDIDNRLANAETDLINKSTAVDTDINNHLNQMEADLQNRATQIDNEISTFQTLAVRTQIEQGLAAGLTIGLFEVPQANGGYLETVRAIVNDTISKLLAAGQAVNGATKWFGLGDTALAQKQYKAAYAYYQTAYTTAVK